MGRRWLGVSTKDYQRMPHADGSPESLWWYARHDRRADAVIEKYLANYARGVAFVPLDFRENLIRWLDDLTTIQNLREWGKQRTKRYWTIPNYARAYGIEPHTLMARMRALERIAIEMFPERAAVHGRFKKRARLSEDEIRQIREKCWGGEDFEAIAKEFKIPASQVGQICEADKSLRRALRTL